MAMAVSTQSGPFKSCCSSSFWFSLPCRQSALTNSMTPLPSRAFSASTKAFHRGELHYLRSANVPCSKITVFSNSIQFKCGSRYSTRPFVIEDAMHRIDGAEQHCSPHWRPVVRVEHNSPLLRMVPYYPNRIGSEGKLLSGGYLNLQRVEEGKKQIPRCIHELITREVEDYPCRSSSYMTPEVTFPKNICLEESKHYSFQKKKESKKLWLKEIKKLKEEREVLHGTKNCRARSEISSDQTIVENEKVEPKGLQDGTASCSFRSSGLDNIAKKVDSQSLFSQEYMSSDLESRSLLNKPSGVGEVDSVRDEGGKNLYKSKLDSSGKSEEWLSEITRFSLDNATKRDPSNGKFGSSFDDLNESYTLPLNTGKECSICPPEHCEVLSRIYDSVLVVDNISLAKEIVGLLTTKYRHLVYACDTEVAEIDVRAETPVDHGEVICFSIYCGPKVDFGNGKSCIWVDVLDGGGRDLLREFAPFFEDPSIKKVWHNYSFDSHVIENSGLKISGFYADTMHMARLWDSSRRSEGGYSLEALTSDPKVMSGDQVYLEGELVGKISMKTIFGKRKLKKDGSMGKLITMAPVEELQREDRITWICYSAWDSMKTIELFGSLKRKLMDMEWVLDGEKKGSMYDFYEEYWRPFGELLVKMETEGMLVDRAYLAEVEKVATVEQQVAARRFRRWASKYCPDALYMNVGSDAQLRQLFFGGMANSKDPTESLPLSRTFKVPNVDKVIKEGKKVPTKFRDIELRTLGVEMKTDMYTATGWPSVSGDALKTLAGKISSEYNWADDANEFQSVYSDETPVNGSLMKDDVDISSYGTAYTAFGEGTDGREACHAIAALCDVCSIDSLISNFILPLQSSHTSGKNGRIHCSLNINTETGRLSARRPNLQNQPALEKDRYKIRQAFIATPGNSLIVADYGQLELRILAHLANCKSMLDAFRAGGDFHSRTAMNMYPHIREAVENKQVLLEWHPQPGEEKPPVPLLKDAFASERRKAKMLNFSIAYGKTPVGLAHDWKVSVEEAKRTVNLWYKERKEVLHWQKRRKKEALEVQCVHTLLGRARCFPSVAHASYSQKAHIERAAINTPVQGSAADVAMCAMLEISRNARLKELGWRLLLQVHDEVILEGPTESAEVAKAIVVECMSKPFYGTNFLKVDLSVEAKCAQNWYAAK